ncbi:MAG: glutamine--fructose-6-phosphate transaminase (isomerizing) [Candidatus Margulisbacteria bacterium]|nr:glutamine--fructose-6-phosphate transaminase (isomerizing) [Candidatus Margulisiibacteriota bacterium]
MCGIFAYIGHRPAVNVIINGLKKLEYRGYDSIGISILDGSLSTYKCIGKVCQLEEKLSEKKIDGKVGIGHTRWATHGEPTEINAHPHINKSGKIALVHNGIIENFQVLKKELIDEGYVFRSQTDSEVIVHLVDKYYKETKDIELAFVKTIKQLDGSYAICLVSEFAPGKIFAVRKGSPLIIGIGDKECFCSSDISPILKYTKQILYLDEEEYAVLTKNQLDIKDFKGNLKPKKVVKSAINIEDVSKGTYDFFMMKEIHEQPDSIIKTIEGRCDIETGNITLNSLNISYFQLLNINRIVITACGTSLHAGLVGEFFLEKLAHIPVEVEYAAEFRYRNPIIDNKTMVLAISQSGETADTLAAVTEAKSKGAMVISICNVQGSTITRESDGVIYTKAGIEIGVASTKAFTAQITALYMFSIYLARIKWLIARNDRSRLIKQLFELPSLIKEVFLSEDEIFKIANKYYKSDNFLFLGRGIGFPVAMEGALKMKEISYIHAEGYSAAEMKHGPIALIDENMPVVVIALKGRSYEKILSNISEVKARKGIVIAIATKGDSSIKQKVDDVIYIPDTEEELTAILSVIPLQLLAYYAAVLRGCHVDQPRNLAKSVTVE